MSGSRADARGAGSILRLLEGLGHWEIVEDLGERLKLPYIPEYELSYFGRLYREELERALRELESLLRRCPPGGGYAVLGRLRRLLGDPRGARDDFQRALALEPDRVEALVGLAEMSPGPERAERLLSRAAGLKPDFPWTHLHLAVRRLARGDDDAARDALERFLRLKPNSCLGTLLLGLAYRGLGRDRAAARAFESAGDKNPACSAAFLLRARASRSRADLVRFVHRAYDSCAYVNHATFEVMFAKAEGRRLEKVCSYEYAKRILDVSFARPDLFELQAVRDPLEDRYSLYKDDGVETCRTFLRENRRLAWARSFLARFFCYDPKAMGRGLEAINRAAALAPRSGWIYGWRGNVHIRMGRLREALKDYSRSIRLQPHYYLAYAWRGVVYQKLGRLREAARDLDRALRMDPNYAYALLGRSLVRRRSGDFAGAAEDIDRAFRRDTKFSWVYRTGRDSSPAEIGRGIRELDRAVGAAAGCPSLYAWRGELKARRGAFAEASEDFGRALRLDPRHAIGLALHGKALLGAGRLEEAADLLKKALRIDPEIRMAAGWLAECRFRQGRTKRAFAALDAVLALHPNTDWPYLLKGQFFLRLGDLNRAADKFERATRINGHCHEGYYFRALADLERGRVRSASDSINKCLTIAPNLGRAYLLRAAVEERRGNPREVLRDYRKVLEEYPYLFNAEQRRRVEILLAGGLSSARSRAPRSRRTGARPRRRLS